MRERKGKKVEGPKRERARGGVKEHKMREKEKDSEDDSDR